MNKRDEVIDRIAECLEDSYNYNCKVGESKESIWIQIASELLGIQGEDLLEVLNQNYHEEIIHLRKVIEAREEEIRNLEKQIEDNAEEEFLAWSKVYTEKCRLKSLLNAENPDQKVLVVIHDQDEDELNTCEVLRRELEENLTVFRGEKGFNIEVWTNKLDIRTSIQYKFQSIGLIEKEKEDDGTTEEDGNDKASEETLEEGWI